ncbi:glycosyl hydrolase family 98 [Deinococcus aerius]|uniref:Glycosyl hydrolase family 98 n=1 Tax=Deinococcus aerius TaxID=200253 RepID=A0A2I9DSR2_9DEIO|nr:NPCBM/NEW2 domain-containing protein [Deinococcus aerius]GBF05557.1 glycosyl hydrolase family 98 [Deinococcus aerius]
MPTHTPLSRGDLSVQPFLRATNARGPAERNRSNGEGATGDGRALTLNGRVYARGLGVHAGSSLSFALGGRCRLFMARVGVDDEVGDRGSVVFQVYADQSKVYDSGPMTGRSATKTVIVPVTGAGELRLVVTDGGDGNGGDHADWVSPQVLGCALNSSPAPRAATRPPVSSPTARRAATPGPAARPAAPQTPASGPVVYRAPITITRGGVYSGNWASSDGTPAVTIRTSEPVVIENARLRGRGDLVRGFGVNLTLRNVQGENLPPNAAGRAPGHAVLVEEIQNLTVENSSFVRGGIYVRKFLGRGAQGIRIRRNTFANIDGRQSGGVRGFSGRVDRRQMVQFNDVQGIPNAEIAWNQVVNRPGESAVEDNINLHASSGTPQSPILIHDNYIQGAYPMNPASQKGYSGGGIMLGDGKVKSPLGNGYVRAWGNQIVSTTNYGIAIAGGSGIEAYGNRVVSSGRLPDGRPIAAMNVGMYVWDINGASNLRPATFGRNVLRDNVSGWTRVGADGRENNNPMWLPHCTLNGSRCANNRDLGKVTLATERAEWDLWQQKLRAAGVAVGAR